MLFRSNLRAVQKLTEPAVGDALLLRLKRKARENLLIEIVVAVAAYVKNDGSLSTKDDVNSNLSSTGKNKSTTNKTTLDVEQFLQLMVAEMQNQDPLEPTDNSDYMAQLATFTQVEATKEMNDNTLQDMASNLVGKQVIMTTTQNSNGYIGGTVDYWETINGTVYLGIGGKLYDIADLDTVMDKDYFDKWKGNGSTTDTKTEDTKPGE